MKKIQNNNLEKLNELFFKEFLRSLEKIKKDRIIIWLSGWSSVLSFYDYIKNNYTKIPEIIREKIVYCFLDERVVALDNNDSNYKLLNDNFFKYLKENNLITEKNILKIDINSDDIAWKYYEEVENIDIWLFGVGPDWHTCSLFPLNELLDDESIWFLDIKNSPKPPTQRITISKNMLTNIPVWFVFFIWEWKKEALNNFLNEKLSYTKCPAKLVMECSESILVSNIY